MEEVQLLLNSIGIRSYYTCNKKHNVEFNNGVYECKESYDLNITSDKNKFSNVRQNLKLRKFSRSDKKEEDVNKLLMGYMDYDSEGKKAALSSKRVAKKAATETPKPNTANYAGKAGGKALSSSGNGTVPEAPDVFAFDANNKAIV
jgi:hypothetical protein